MTHDTQSLPVLSGRQRKPLDFGHAGIAASISRYGRVLSIFAADPVHGQVVVAPWAQFPEDKLYDQPYVRKYRARALELVEDGNAGFGMTVAVGGATGSADKEWSYDGGSWPATRVVVNDVSLAERYAASDGMLLHTITARNESDAAQEATVSFGGHLSVHRAPYAQLTPQGVCTIPPFANHFVASATVAIYNHFLGVSLQAGLFIDDEPQPLTPKEATSKTGPTEYNHTVQCPLAPGQERTFSFVYKVDRTEPRPASRLPSPTTLTQHISSSLDGISFPLMATFLGGADRGQALAHLVLRNIDYMLGLCCIPLTVHGDDAGTCVIADHACLPLGWNRDNYYQLRLLYDLYPHLDAVCLPGQVAAVQARFKEAMQGHLRWAYETARRPKGYWGRSFFINGEPKDAVFQLDQQCYPLLELAEYAALFATPESPDDVAFVTRLAGHVDTILSTLRDHQFDADERKLWLFKTDETPADDLVAFPYHFSSHILLWRTLSSLSVLQHAIAPGTINSDVAEWARRVRADTLEHFVAVNPATGKSMYAYLTSTTGEYQWYHDANDLPTALAPRWGFCDLETDEWRNTIAFAFSEANEEGFFPGGEYGGLGSVHTRDPWPLGDAQLLVIKAQRGEDVGHVLDKLVREVQWDGLFSEAVDRHTGVVTSKHWFSWPGAFTSSALVTFRDQVAGSGRI